MTRTRSRLSVAALSLLTVAAMVAVLMVGRVLSRALRAQTGDPPPPADALPVISLSVLSANPSVSGFRPGVRAYFTTSITDDKGLRSVVVTTSQMLFSSSPIPLMQCDGRTSCEEKVYIIVPAVAGQHFVTVTATDSAGQVAVKTESFFASACATDAECGGGSIQWAGATYCGSETNASIPTDVMQYGVAAVCRSGICDTGSQPLVKQKCNAGQMCSMVNYNPTCVQQPPACTPNAPIGFSCLCGGSIPVTAGYCCVTTNSIYQSFNLCPAMISSVPSSAQPVRTGTTGSTAILSSPLTSSPALLTTAPRASTPDANAYTVGSPSATTPSATPSATVPAGSPPPPAFPWMTKPASSQRPAASEEKTGEHDAETIVQKLRASQVRTLSSRKKLLLRELQSLERTAKRAKNTDALAHLAELRADVIAFVPVDTSSYDLMLDYQEELEVLRLEVKRKPLRKAKSIPIEHP